MHSQHQPQKIQNPEVPIAKSPHVNDRDLVNDMLTLEKYMTSSYNVALDEASNYDLYQMIFSIFRETQDCQRKFFNLMFMQGWYTLEAADQQKISQTYEKFSNYTNQFPYH